MGPEPSTIATLADKHVIESRPWERQVAARNVYEALCETADANPAGPAVSFQLKSGPRDAATTLDWATLRAEVTKLANLIHAGGVQRGETVALLMPNMPETAVALLAAMTAGAAAPINPLLEPAQIAAILRETEAKALITLKPFVKTDIARKAAAASSSVFPCGPGRPPRPSATRRRSGRCWRPISAAISPDR